MRVFYTMKKYTKSKIAIIINIICLLILLKINITIAHDFASSTGKTRALFEIIELLSYSYKYYLLPIQILAIVLTLTAIKNKESVNYSWLALMSCLLSVLAMALPLWKYMHNIYL